MGWRSSAGRGAGRCRVPPRPPAPGSPLARIPGHPEPGDPRGPHLPERQEPLAQERQRYPQQAQSQQPSHGAEAAPPSSARPGSTVGGARGPAPARGPRSAPRPASRVPAHRPRRLRPRRGPWPLSPQTCHLRHLPGSGNRPLPPLVRPRAGHFQFLHLLSLTDNPTGISSRLQAFLSSRLIFKDIPSVLVR